MTANFSTMTLVIAVSYGGMWDIAEAAKQIAQDAVNQKIQIQDINVDLFGQ